jgi:hypothetical protein
MCFGIPSSYILFKGFASFGGVKKTRYLKTWALKEE